MCWFIFINIAPVITIASLPSAVAHINVVVRHRVRCTVSHADTILSSSLCIIARYGSAASLNNDYCADVLNDAVLLAAADTDSSVDAAAAAIRAQIFSASRRSAHPSQS